MSSDQIMPGQSALFEPDPLTLARTTDPTTSHQAAASLTDVRTSQAAVLAVLRLMGTATDEELSAVYDMRRVIPHQSPSGLRTRRRELVAVGLVIDTGFRRTTAAGRRAIVWACA